MSLIVYSASAGSGKTYTIARHYIDLLVQDPNNYKKILAVTFTNKATAEMKNRIVGDLFLMSSNPDSLASDELRANRRSLLERHLDMRKAQNPNFSEKDVVAQCRAVLRLILRDYSHFGISTIDSFVQGVIRAFAFEEGLPANYGVELNDVDMANGAVDRMMANLSGNKSLKKWVVGSAEKIIQQGRKIKSLEDSFRLLGKKILRDDWNLLRNHIPHNVEEVEALSGAIYARLDDVSNDILDAYEALHDSISDVGGWKGTCTFVSKSGVFSASKYALYLSRRAKSRACDVVKDVVFANSVVKDGNDASYYFKNLSSPDLTLLQSFIATVGSLSPDFYSYVSLLKHIDSLAVLAELDSIITDIQKEEHKLLIGSTGARLKGLIDEEHVPIPFIYEKFGSRYDHLMIDEFQDSSRVQYDNFRPLLAESLSANHDCLVVGDVKQSIYRFRNGDWTMLNSQLCADFPEFFHRDNLQKNWRSSSAIVRFNNLLYDPQQKDADGHSGFDDCASAEQVAQLSAHHMLPLSLPLALDNQFSNEKDKCFAAMYWDGFQFVGRQSAGDASGALSGYVRVKFFKKDDDADSDPEQLIADEYVGAIRNLLSLGYQLRDFAFLVRKNKEGQAVADVLSAEGFEVVSDDSLSVVGATSVSCILDMMRCVVRRDLAALFRAASVVYELSYDDLVCRWTSVSAELEAKLCECKGLGLLDLTSVLAKMLPAEVVKNERRYISALCDIVRDAIDNGLGSLTEFLEYADVNKADWHLRAPDNLNAIRIMTVHKAKGLDSEVVFIPHLDWSAFSYSSAMKKQIIWPEVGNDCPAEEVRGLLVPLEFDRELEKSSLAYLFENEKKMMMADSLNTAYVATTRARSVMFIWGVQNKDGGRMSDYLASVLSLHNDAPEPNSGADAAGSFLFELGTLASVQNAPAVAKADSCSVSNNDIVVDAFPVDVKKLDFKINDDFRDDISDADGGRSAAYVGLLKHNIMERILVRTDFDKACNMVLRTSDLLEDERNRVVDLLAHCLDNPKAREWFDGSMAKVWTEISIIDNEFHKIRPDRVMMRHDGSIVLVDYKFGRRYVSGKDPVRTVLAPDGKSEVPKRFHDEQVLVYVDALKKIWPNARIEAYLWYMAENDFVLKIL